MSGRNCRFDVRTWLIFLILALAGCQAPPREDAGRFREYAKPEISASAKGWSLSVSNDRGTIISSPNGKSYDIGETQFPDWAPTGLYLIKEKTLNQRFLIIQTPPIASAATPLVIVKIDAHDVPVRIIDIKNRFEWMTQRVTEDDILRGLFVDMDGDGVSELVERDIWKDGGFINYYKWRGGVFALFRTERVPPPYE